MALQIHATQQTRLAALRKKLDDLHTELKHAQSAVSVTDFYLAQIKKKKLLIKDEMLALQDPGNRASGAAG